MSRSVYGENNILINKKLEEAQRLDEWNLYEAARVFLLSKSDYSPDEVEAFYTETFSDKLLSEHHATFCRILSEISETKSNIFSEENDVSTDTLSSIAYLKNAFSDKAYKVFSDSVINATAQYYPSFKEICEEVYYGRVKYAILPLFTSEDGVLSSFRKLCLKYDLKIVCTSKIETDGDNFIEFALIKKELSNHFGGKERIILLSVIPDSTEQIGTIINSIEKLDSKIISVSTNSIEYSLTQSCFDIRLSIDEKNLLGLFLFLECSHIRYNIIGNFVVLQ